MAIVRIEQLYPFPSRGLRGGAARTTPNATRGRVVPGRTAEPGRLVPDPPSAAGAAVRTSRNCCIHGSSTPAAAPAAGIVQLHSIQQTGLVAAAINGQRRRKNPTRSTARLRSTDPAGRRSDDHRSHAFPQLPESVADATLVSWHKQPKAMPWAATRISSTSRPTRWCWRCRRRPRAASIKELKVAERCHGHQRAGAGLASRKARRRPRRPRTPVAKATERRRGPAEKQEAAPASGRQQRSSLAPSVRRLVEEHKLEAGRDPGQRAATAGSPRGDVLAHIEKGGAPAGAVHQLEAAVARL